MRTVEVKQRPGGVDAHRTLDTIQGNQSSGEWSWSAASTAVTTELLDPSAQASISYSY